MTNNTAEQLKCREAFEDYMLNDVKCVVGSRDPYPAGIEREQWKTWKSAWNAATRADSGEAVAYMHTMHCEYGQKMTRLSKEPFHSFGEAGRDYSAEYVITSQPLFTHPSSFKVGRDD